jgi:membrane protease YdiL (CAAX protease family)
MLTAAPLFGIRLTEMFSLDPVSHPEQLHALKYIQIIGALGTFIFSSLLLSFLYTGSWVAFFSFRSPGVVRALGLAFIMIAGLPFVNYLTEINSNMTLPVDGLESLFRNLEEETEEVMMLLVRADTFGMLLLNLFMIAVIPAVGEELVFRGLIQRHLTDWLRNPHLAILLASAIFSLAHFQVYSFLPRFFLGMVLGYSFLYGRSIWYPVIGHFVNNAVGVAFYYLHLRDRAGDALEEIGTQEMMPFTALYSFLVVAGLMALWIRMNRVSRSVPSL